MSEPPGQCGFAFGTVVNNPDRLTSCSDTVWTLFTYVVDIFGNVTITGVLSFDDEQWTTYSTGAGNWDHGMQITAAGGQGDLAAGTTLDVSSTCDLASSACIAFSNTIPDPQSVAFVSGGPAEPFDWAEFDTGASASVPGQTNTLDATLGASIVANTPGYPPAAFTDSGSGLAGRCDSIVTSSDGCVNEQSIPTMNLSISVYGASAAMIQWAQENLSGHWGLQGQGQPLHRLFNSILQGDNRTIICQDGSFTADQNITNALTPYKDNDSCDEFPFASTYESGAMVDDVNSNQKPFVTTGADCAQVTAVHTGTSGNNEAADWATTTVNGTPTLTEPCVRGHIPQALNSLVGTAYSTTITTNHLIDKDAFWLSVSP